MLNIFNSFKKVYKNFIKKNEENFYKIKDCETRLRGKYVLSEDDFYNILKEELGGNTKKLKKYFSSFENELSELKDGMPYFIGDWVQYCDSDSNSNLTQGKRYKKIKKGVDWYVGGGTTTYTVKNDIGEEEDYLFFDFINYKRHEFNKIVHDYLD